MNILFIYIYICNIPTVGGRISYTHRALMAPGTHFQHRHGEAHKSVQGPDAGGCGDDVRELSVVMDAILDVCTSPEHWEMTPQ